MDAARRARAGFPEEAPLENLDLPAADLLSKGDPSFAILALERPQDVGPNLRRELIRLLSGELEIDRRRTTQLEKNRRAAYVQDLKLFVRRFREGIQEGTVSFGRGYPEHGVRDLLAAYKARLEAEQDKRWRARLTRAIPTLEWMLANKGRPISREAAIDLVAIDHNLDGLESLLKK